MYTYKYYSTFYSTFFYLPKNYSFNSFTLLLLLFMKYIKKGFYIIYISYRRQSGILERNSSPEVKMECRRYPLLRGVVFSFLKGIELHLGENRMRAREKFIVNSGRLSCSAVGDRFWTSPERCHPFPPSPLSAFSLCCSLSIYNGRILCKVWKAFLYVASPSHRQTYFSYYLYINIYKCI